MRLFIPLLAGFAFAGAAHAEIVATFEEGAPRDRFQIRNAASCDAGPTVIEINLTGSAGKLIFDTTGTGPGVNVAQPFRITAGGERVVSVSQVGDGDTRVRVELSALAPGEVFAFTGDVDDQLPDSPLGPTRVEGAEIAGAKLLVSSAGAPLVGVFTAAAEARAPYSACLS